VAVPPPAPNAVAAEACRRLNAALPAELDGLESRATSPASELTHAWGRPAVVLRCGVASPPALEPTSQLFTADGVDWLPVEGPRTWTFTTTGRVAHVEVTVPKDHDPTAGPLVDLARPITETVPLVGAGAAPTKRPTLGSTVTADRSAAATPSG
jgi:uncharacterized protein DUF3515